MIKYILLMMLVTSGLKAQNQNFVKGKVIEINSSNSFRIIDEKNKERNVLIYQTKPVTEPDEITAKAIQYLEKKIKDREVYVFLEEVRKDTLKGSVLYNCVKDDKNSTIKTDLPCMAGNNLNIELIQQGFVKYTGDNEFLKNLAGKRKP